MVGYSGTPLERKLGVKDDVVLLDRAPEGFALDASTTRRLPRSLTLALTFHTHRRTLESRLPALLKNLTRDGAIWVCWPKKTAPSRPASDLDENLVRAIGLDHGVVDVKVAAIDDTWSGLKFVRRLADR